MQYAYRIAALTSFMMCRPSSENSQSSSIPFANRRPYMLVVVEDIEVCGFWSLLAHIDVIVAEKRLGLVLSNIQFCGTCGMFQFDAHGAISPAMGCGSLFNLYHRFAI
jgi:hypothetical protein